MSDRVLISPPVIREEIARWLPNETSVAVAEFLAWCDTTGEHEGQPWAAMVDTLRETQP